MNESNTNYEEIEAYLEGRLEGEALEAFETQMKNSPALAREVALHRDLSLAFSEQKAMELEDTLLAIRKERLQKRSPAPIRALSARLRLAAAAVSLLLIAGLAYLFWPAGEPSLMAAYYEPYPLYLSTRSAEPSEESFQNKQLETAAAGYQAGNYAAALPAFQALITTTIHNAPYHFYAGICQLELGRPLEASIHLEEAVARQDAQFTEPAEWYLALAYLQQGKAARARALLEKIVREGGSYSEKAGEVLGELE